MGRLELKGVCEKAGRLYYRRKVAGQDTYIRLPAADDPAFAEEYTRAARPETISERPKAQTIGAMALAYRASPSFKRLSANTKQNRVRYLRMIEEMDGHRTVAGCTRPAVRKMRDRFADMPGKANNWLASFKQVMEMAIEAELLRENPARGIVDLDIGEYEPWPADVLKNALAKASPMLRLAIVTGLCSGARISDVIRMQHGWHDGSIMEFTTKKRVGRQRKGVAVAVPMHHLWLAEIRKVPRKAVTLLYDRSGKPFSETDILQERVKRLMLDIGSPTYVSNGVERRYTFHGLRKNAACYLAEMGLNDGQIGAICAMTPDTVRKYTKRSSAYMIAQGAAENVKRGDVLSIKGGRARGGAK